MSNKFKDRLVIVLVLSPLVALSAFIFLNEGSDKTHQAHKAQHRTYAQAGADLQREFTPALEKEGYGFEVAACYHDKADQYICAAYVSQGNTKVCSVIKFTDKTGTDVKVSNAGQARDPGLCK